MQTIQACVRFGVLSVIMALIVTAPVHGLSTADMTAMAEASRKSEQAAAAEAQLIVPSTTDQAQKGLSVINTTDGITHCGITTDHTAVFLTFDDSGTTSQITKILSVLRTYNVRGLFFPTGQFASDRPDLIRLIKSEGHFVGNHSYSHPDLTTLSDSQIRSEITRAESAIRPYPSNRKSFRNPYGAGSFDSRIVNILNSYSYQGCFWTVDTRDWAGTSASSMLANVKANTRARGVILFHVHGRYTGDVLPSVIQYIKTTHYGMPKLNP